MIYKIALTFAMSINIFGTADAQIINPGAFEKLRQDTMREARATINPLMNRYCYESCELIDVKVEVQEELAQTEDLGFEGVSDKSDKMNYYVRKVLVEMQIDDRITTANRLRLENIFLNHLKAFGVSTEVVWRPVSIPSIGSGATDEKQLKGILEDRITTALGKVITRYCPEQCILAQINTEGTLIPPDDAQTLPNSQVVMDKTGRTVMRVDSVDINVTMAEELDLEIREKIASIMRAKVRFVSPMNLNVSVVPFPESYAAKRDRVRQESKDPFGLEKLRQMLTIFKELAGTKEIITSTTAEQKSEAISKDRRSDSTSSQEFASTSNLDWIWIIMAALAALLIVGALVVKMLGLNKDAQMMMRGAPAGDDMNGEGNNLGAGQGMAGAGGDVTQRLGLAAAEGVNRSEEMMKKMKIEKIRSELVEMFIENPKVARETFARMLKEQGVEDTAKYVHILGHMVVFNLLDDPRIQRELYELSEYFHKSDFNFEIDEEYALLETLKTKVTATEIKILSRRALEKFDFLAKLDSEQIFKLISEENPKVQSIVLTQLEKKKRMAVFNMYKGQEKINLMNELSRADAIPKEYLNNVANALNKKVTARPEFDTTNLRASDILIDLMERASLEEQRRLMANLSNSNPDTARTLKIRLVTVEMLPFLKDGHLLELIMGMDRDDLLAFLMGCMDHIRDLLLSKAPQELSDSWQEDLGYMASVDDSNYRVVEMQILARIRNLANNGAISILDINDMIFADQTFDDDEQGEVPQQLSQNSMVA